MYVLRDQYEVYCVGVNANRQGGTSIYSQSRPKGNAQINPAPGLPKCNSLLSIKGRMISQRFERPDTVIHVCTIIFMR